MRQELDKAAFTGVYGSDNEWQTLIQHPAAILRPSAHPPLDGYEVVSVKRYQHAFSLLGCSVDPNPLEKFFHDDLHRSLPNDAMHMIELGLFKHVMTAIHAKYATAIQQMTDDELYTSVGPQEGGRAAFCKKQFQRRWEFRAWLDRAFQRLERRLQDCGLSTHVAGAFATYSQHVQNKDGRKPWSSMQAVEISALVKMLPFALRGLLAPERKIVQSWKAAGGDGPDVVEDPSESICDFLAMLLTWVSLISRQELTESMVVESDAMAKDIMERLPCVFPHRRWDGQAGVGTSWNFPKLHQMHHIADQIRR